MARTLASIQKISKIEPIPNADAIEVCSMENLGWKVVAKKNTLKVGDLVVYFEIDSALPIDPRFEFLRKTSYRAWKLNGAVEKECFRLKTIKLRGQISQGLIIPLTDFPEITKTNIGTDVTAILKVEHFDELKEKYIALASGGLGEVVGKSFPWYISRTDETRLQNLLKHFEDKRDVHYTAEVKADGTSLTCFYVDEKFSKDRFGICNRNNLLKKVGTDRWGTFVDSLKGFSYVKTFAHFKANVLRTINALIFGYEKTKYHKIVEELGLEIKLKDYFEKTKRNLAFQGELVGPKINGNRDRYTEYHLLLFNIYDIDNSKYLGQAERHEIAKELQLEEVTVLEYDFVPFNTMTTLDDFLNYVKGKTPRGNEREGVVFKAIDGSHSFKVINNDYLLSEKD